MGEKCPGTAQPCACFAYYAECTPGDAFLIRKGAECDEVSQHAHTYLGEGCSNISSVHRKMHCSPQHRVDFFPAFWSHN